MAYFNQERKAQMMPALKELCAAYGVKASFGVKNHSTFACVITSSRINFVQDYISDNQDKNVTTINVNEHYIHNSFTGEAKEFLLKLKGIMMEGNWNNSDPMTDYFDVGWYIDISIGKWDRPYKYDPSIKPKALSTEPKPVKKREPKPIVKALESNNRVLVAL